MQTLALVFLASGTEGKNLFLKAARVLSNKTIFQKKKKLVGQIISIHRQTFKSLTTSYVHIHGLFC